MLREYNEAFNAIRSSEDGTVGRLMFLISITSLAYAYLYQRPTKLQRDY